MYSNEMFFTETGGRLHLTLLLILNLGPPHVVLGAAFVGIAWWLVRNADSQTPPTPRSLGIELHFYKSPICVGV